MVLLGLAALVAADLEVKPIQVRLVPRERRSAKPLRSFLRACISHSTNSAAAEAEELAGMGVKLGQEGLRAATACRGAAASPLHRQLFYASRRRTSASPASPAPRMPSCRMAAWWAWWSITAPRAAWAAGLARHPSGAHRSPSS